MSKTSQRKKGLRQAFTVVGNKIGSRIVSSYPMIDTWQEAKDAGIVRGISGMMYYAVMTGFLKARGQVDEK